MNWPYIGPVIKHNDNGTSVVSEAIITSEGINTYTCIFKAMVSIEPHWSSYKLQSTHADDLITNRLLKNLKVENSCILHVGFFR